MIDPKTQQEPSMEEILASIRKIISDEDTEDVNAGEDGVKEAPEAPEVEVAPEAAKATPEAGAADDEILDLTEVVETAKLEGEVASPAPEVTSAESVAPVADEPVASPEEAPVAEPALDNEAQAAGTEPEPADEPGEEVAAVDAAKNEALGDDGALADRGLDDGYLSEGAASASTATLKELAQALNQQAETADRVAIGSPNLTLEEIVRDLLRPMLREWLDENLHTLVERAVRREIERMVRKAEDLSENT
jgi:cell pole-organizing protein PopZ